MATACKPLDSAGASIAQSRTSLQPSGRNWLFYLASNKVIVWTPAGTRRAVFG
jgi:hypothetical protein